MLRISAAGRAVLRVRSACLRLQHPTLPAATHHVALRSSSSSVATDAASDVSHVADFAVSQNSLRQQSRRPQSVADLSRIQDIPEGVSRDAWPVIKSIITKKTSKDVGEAFLSHAQGGGTKLWAYEDYLLVLQRLAEFPRSTIKVLWHLDQEMVKLGMRKDAYIALIKAYSGMPARSELEWFPGTAERIEALALAAHEASITFPRSTFEAVIGMFAARNDAENADLWFQRALSVGHRPNGQMYAAIIKAYANMKDLYNAQVWFEQVLESRIPYTAAYDAFIQALAANGRAAAAEDIIARLMPEKGATPDSRTYNALITGCIAAGDIEKVGSIINKLESDPALPNPTPLMYTNLLTACCRSADYPNAAKAFKHLSEAVENNGWRPLNSEVATYGDFIRLAVDNKDIKQAFDAFKMLSKFKFLPAATPLGRAFVAQKMYPEAKEWLQLVTSPTFGPSIPLVAAIASDIAKMTNDLKELLEIYRMCSLKAEPYKMFSVNLWNVYWKHPRSTSLTVEEYTTLFSSLKHSLTPSRTRTMALKFLDDMIESHKLQPTQELSDIVVGIFEKEQNSQALVDWAARVSGYGISTPALSEAQSQSAQGFASVTEESNKLAAYMSKSQTENAEQLASEFFSRGVLPTPPVASAYVKFASKNGGVASAVKAYDEMLRISGTGMKRQWADVYRNRLDWAMVSVYVSAKEHAKAIELMENWREHRTADNEERFFGALDALAESMNKAGDVEFTLVRKVLKLLPKEGQAPSRSVMDKTAILMLRSITELTEGQATAEELNEATNVVRGLYRSMKSYKWSYAPSESFYARLLSAFGHLKSAEDIQIVLEPYVEARMTAQTGFSSDVVLAAVSAYFAVGLPDQALRMYAVAKATPTRIGSAVYSRLVQGLSERGSWDKAVEVVDDMHARGSHFTNLNGNAVEAFAKSLKDSDVKSEKAERWLESWNAAQTAKGSNAEATKAVEA
ncbi:hypothetical protein HDU85_005295 [Gaertneriomyces sp. JEL0708]|nr:hypothetical protein HDU85_005295 [Gaertneriomyces sp. JEL0708]